MTELNEHDLRKQKVTRLREIGIDPFLPHGHRSITIAQFRAEFSTLQQSGAKHTVAGRLRLKRGHGKLMFMQLEDHTGTIQLVFSHDTAGEKLYTFVEDFFDVGDIVQVKGTAFITQKGEESVMVSDAIMLTKSVAGLPDKWHGIQDEETRFRKRYVDMIMRPEMREMLVRKSRFWNAMRSFLVEEGFIEVETPVLESTPGGADAQPFITHHNALDIDLYLRISMGELWQKRLMVAGFDKTFELGRQFRNEGISPEHLQDYTQMEFYWGYANYRDGMKLVERMYKHCIMQAFGRLQFTIRGFEVNFDQPWKEIDYVEAVQNELGINVLDASNEELQRKCKELGLNPETNTRGRMIDTLWKVCRKKIGGPAFLINHPVEVSPLSKRKPEDPRLVERFQVLVAGSEQGNGYSELNDPFDQEERFEEQAKMREAGDNEAQMHDADFVAALKVGMPPTCGFGVSERLFSFLMDKPIRECVAFPLLRPKNESTQQNSSEAQTTSTDADKSTETFDAGITYEKALALMLENITDENLRRHNRATGIIMRALGTRLSAAQPENWEIAGVLHDVDYEKAPEIDRHSIVGAQMLQDLNVHPLIVDAVREHNHQHNLEPKTMMSKALKSLEQITGLISACAFVQPDKKLASVKLSSLKKKIKDKSFARGVDRTMLSQCEALTGIPFDEAVEICLKAMQERAAELGL
ncbi:MAG: lysine--tRNA ligase [Candidatus Kerfeldbacteria bacterium]|nr:lysine--tRNA ligase [Candidatus Kerfeldbacteria bacterium]